MRSEKPVSFFTFVKASEVKDVKKYNHAVSVFWSAGTVLFEILGIPLLFISKAGQTGEILWLFNCFVLHIMLP
mgnify:CR=1 FL=1